MLIIQRPDGQIRLYTTKDGQSSRLTLAQMAVDCQALAFIQSSDDTQGLRGLAVAGQLADKSDPTTAPWIPVSACIETATGFVYTDIPTAAAEPPIQFSEDALAIRDWCEQCKRDARWLSTLENTDPMGMSKSRT